MLYYKYGANKYFLPQTYKALYQKSEAKAKTLAADAWSFLTSLNGVSMRRSRHFEQRYC